MTIQILSFEIHHLKWNGCSQTPSYNIEHIKFSGQAIMSYMFVLLIHRFCLCWYCFLYFIKFSFFFPHPIYSRVSLPIKFEYLLSESNLVVNLIEHILFEFEFVKNWVKFELLVNNLSRVEPSLERVESILFTNNSPRLQPYFHSYRNGSR